MRLSSHLEHPLRDFEVKGGGHDLAFGYPVAFFHLQSANTPESRW